MKNMKNTNDFKVMREIDNSKNTEKQIVQSRAAYKAHRTRKVNALLREYNEAQTAGKKAAIKRKINQINSEPLPL